MKNGVYRAGNDLFPRMIISLPYTFNGYEVKAEITNAVFENINNEDASLITEQVPGEIEITAKISVEHRQSQVFVTLLPLRKNLQTKIVERLLSFDLVLQRGAPIAPSNTNSRTYAASSVLSTGDWYKIAVTQNGIHKVTYNFLQSLGINMSALTFQKPAFIWQWRRFIT